MNLLERVQLARQKFIRYYERGKSNPERWDRPMSVYLYWSVEEEEYSHFDNDVLDIIARTGSIHPVFSTFDDAMRRFDLAERFVKLWLFS
jgi:hypothetical protein